MGVEGAEALGGAKKFEDDDDEEESLDEGDDEPNESEPGLEWVNKLDGWKHRVYIMLVISIHRFIS